MLQHNATHCSTLQHTATHGNTLQLAKLLQNCNTVQHTNMQGIIFMSYCDLYQEMTTVYQEMTTDELLLHEHGA